MSNINEIILLELNKVEKWISNRPTGNGIDPQVQGLLDSKSIQLRPPSRFAQHIDTETKKIASDNNIPMYNMDDTSDRHVRAKLKLLNWKAKKDPMAQSLSLGDGTFSPFISPPSDGTIPPEYSGITDPKAKKELEIQAKVAKKLQGLYYKSKPFEIAGMPVGQNLLPITTRHELDEWRTGGFQPNVIPNSEKMGVTFVGQHGVPVGYHNSPQVLSREYDNIKYLRNIDPSVNQFYNFRQATGEYHPNILSNANNIENIRRDFQSQQGYDSSVHPSAVMGIEPIPDPTIYGRGILPAELVRQQLNNPENPPSQQDVLDYWGNHVRQELARKLQN